MKKHYLLTLLLLSSVLLHAQTNIFSEDFSSCEGTYAEFGTHTDGFSDFFIRNDGTNKDTNCSAAATTGNIAFTGASGYYYEAEDTDSPDNPNIAGGAFGSGVNSVGVHFTGINVSGYNNVQIKLNLAATTAATFELSDYLNIYVDPTQSGAYSLIGSFHANTSVGSRPLQQDTDFDGEGDGSTLTETFTTYAFDVPSSATTMNVRIELWSAGGSQNMAFDTFVVEGDLAASTTWSGSWSGGAPDANTDAIIASSTPTGDFTCKDLTINSGVSLGFNASQTVTIRGTSLTNNGNGLSTADATAELVFNNDGNIISLSGNALSLEGIANVSGTTTLATGGLLTLSATSATSFGQLTGTGTVSGTINAEAFLDASTGRYFNLGAPFTNAVLSDFNESGATMVSANTAQGTAWEWDASNAEWDPAGNGNLANTATRGKGYSIFAGNNGAFGPFLLDDGDQTGTITLAANTNNDATVSIGLNYNNGQSSAVSFVGGTSEASTEGWNLVSNPYLAVYDWDSQTIPTNMSSAYYYSNGTNYFTYTKGAGTASRYIAPFQGFFVQLTDNASPNLDFERGNRTPGQSATLTKTSSYTLDGVNLHLSSTASNQLFDDVYIGYDANASSAFDSQWDAHKLLNRSPAPNFYTRLGQESYAVCRVSYNGPKSFPLYLAYATHGEGMQITLEEKNLTSFSKLELEDLKQGIRHDLKSGTYSFVHDTAYSANRFVLHFSQSTVGQEEAVWVKAYAHYTTNGIQLYTGTTEPVDVEVYNLAGQLVYRTSAEYNTCHLPIMAQGLFILKLKRNKDSQTIKVLR